MEVLLQDLHKQDPPPAPSHLQPPAWQRRCQDQPNCGPVPQYTPQTDHCHSQDQEDNTAHRANTEAQGHVQSFPPDCRRSLAEHYAQASTLLGLCSETLVEVNQAIK